MRKTALILAFSMLLTSLVACSSDTTTTDTTTTESTSADTTAADTAAEAVVYPTEDVTLIIPFVAGGAGDLIGRIAAMGMDANTDVSVTAVNMGGASATTGALEVIDADADGYTLLMSYGGYPIANLLGIADFTYEDFEPVTMMLFNEMGLFTNASGEYDDLDSIITYAKANPGEFKIGAGMGTVAHFAALALEKIADIDLQIVEVGGDVPKESELLSNRIDAYFDTFGTANQYVASGDFQIASTFGTERCSYTPDVPTAMEQGVDMELMQHWGIWAPKDTPDEVIAQIHELVCAAWAEETSIEQAESSMMYVECLPADEYAAYLEKEFALYASVADALS